MTFTRPTILAGVSLAALLALTACNNNETPVQDTPPADTMAPAAAEPMVGGASMSPTATIVTNASKASNLTTLVSAVQTAGLVETLNGPGPYTVFAPDNAAFQKLPSATVDGLMAPAGKADLTKILTYHVVPGRLTAADLAAKAKMMGGKAELTTVAGAKLTASRSPSGGWMLTDTKGGTANITIADVMQSNGVIHEIDAIVMP